jgi:hypothetical protein
MTERDLNRLREDLTTMQQAAQLGLPFGWADVWGSFGLGLWGGLLTVWVTLAPQAHPRLAWVLLGVVVAPVLWKGYGRRATQTPLRRREYRNNLIATLVGVPVLMGFLNWALRGGVPLQWGCAIIAFVAGMFAIHQGLTDRTRRYYLGIGLPSLLAGIALPLCTRPEDQLPIVVGVLMAALGLSTSAIQAWQLSNDARKHVTN